MQNENKNLTSIYYQLACLFSLFFLFPLYTRVNLPTRAISSTKNKQFNEKFSHARSHEFSIGRKKKVAALILGKKRVDPCVLGSINRARRETERLARLLKIQWTISAHEKYPSDRSNGGTSTSRENALPAFLEISNERRKTSCIMYERCITIRK